MYTDKQNKKPVSRLNENRQRKNTHQTIEQSLVSNSTIRFRPDLNDENLKNKNMYTIQRYIHFSEYTKPEEAVVDCIEIVRPAGTGAGEHTTAFVVFIQEIYTAILHNTYKNALFNLRKLGKGLFYLPGYKRELYQPILEYLAFVNDGDKQSPLNWGATLENIAYRYLNLRNLFNYTYHDSGRGKSGGHAEGNAINSLYKLLQIFPEDVNNISTNIVALFDTNNCQHKKGEIFLRWEYDMKDLWNQHIMTMRRAFPTLSPYSLNLATQQFEKKIGLKEGTLGLVYFSEEFK